LKITDRVSSLVWILDDERAAGEHVLPRDLVPVLVLRVVKFPEESRAQWQCWVQLSCAATEKCRVATNLRPREQKQQSLDSNCYESDTRKYLAA